MKKKKMIIKLFVDTKKEEAFLNRMNEKGWKLTSVRFGALYTFERTEPNEYKTVLHYAERMNHLLFIREVTDNGCEVVHQDNISDSRFYKSKNILFYINIPADSKNPDFLTDNQSRIDSKKKYCTILKFEKTLWLITLISGILALLRDIISYCIAVYFSPLGYYRISLVELILVYIGVFGLVFGGIMFPYCSHLYRRTKREINELSSEEKQSETKH